MSTDYLVLTHTPVTLDNVAEALAAVESSLLIRSDSMETMVIAVDPKDDRPSLWLEPSQHILEPEELARLLGGGVNLEPFAFWTELHGPTTDPQPVASLAQSLAVMLNGRALLMGGSES